MVETALSRHFAAKQTATQRFNSVMSSQLHVACTRAFQLIYTTTDQSGAGSHFGSCSALPFLLNSLQLHNATLMRRFRFYVGKFKDFSRPYSGIQGLFKDFFAIQDFSRIYYKIQGLFKTVRTLNLLVNFSFKGILGQSSVICFRSRKHTKVIDQNAFYIYTKRLKTTDS